MNIDEIRCERIIVADVFKGSPPILRPNGCCSHQQPAGLFISSVLSAVVNRSSLRTGKERNAIAPMRIRRLCQGDHRAFATPRGMDFLSAPLTLARSWDLPLNPKRVPGEKRKRSYVLN